MRLGADRSLRRHFLRSRIIQFHFRYHFYLLPLRHPVLLSLALLPNMFGSKKRARSWAHMPIKSAMKESDVPPCGRALMHGTAMLQPKSVFQQAKAEQGCCVTFLYLIFFFEVLAMIARPVAGGVQLYMANFNGVPHVSPRTRERERKEGRVCVRGADVRARALRCAMRLNVWMGCGWG